jgi:hypothetical protein
MAGGFDPASSTTLVAFTPSSPGGMVVVELAHFCQDILIRCADGDIDVSLVFGFFSVRVVEASIASG